MAVPRVAATEEDPLRPACGALLSPYTWRRLEDIVRAGRIEQLGRSEAGYARYLREFHTMKAEWRSTADCVRCRHYGFLQAVDAASGMKIAVAPVGYDAPSFLRLRPNDYPYYTEVCVTHYVLWSGVPLDRARVEAALAVELPGHCIIWFENGARKSIKALPHVQVFARKAASGEAATMVGYGL
eukprot:TRINITY_DN4762_c0_g1_i1.p1 TRINITY_DN4762_c0_g1~~TRINITY_DN4762_c0_g1_i1.p1  ORF type:complete len:184 (-),score=53.10 TRINITY_DN4762_c0_g1_i1:45-596(-)